MQTLFRKLFIPVPIGLALLTAGATALAVTTPGVNGSIPGFSWSLRSTPVTDHNWSGLAYGTVSGAPRFVAVGNAGATSDQGVMTSPDGVNWTQRTASAAHSWAAVTHNGSNQFVAVGSITGDPVYDGAMYSADGITWTTATTPSYAVTYSSVAYGNGTYVAVSPTLLLDTDPNRFRQVMTSTDGITWTSRQSAEKHPWNSVAFGNNVFVAVAGSSSTGNFVMTSPDGINWTARAGHNKGWQSVTYADGKFVAVAISGTGQRVMTSPDGINWTLQTTPADYNSYSVTYGNGLFVAVAYSGTGQRVMTSPNGTDWTLRDSAADQFWSSVTYGDGRFVAVSATGTGTRAMSSGGPCGDGLAYTTNQWLMVGVPCEPDSNTVAGTFGNYPTANFVAGAYDVATTGWVMYERYVRSNPSRYDKLTSNLDFSAGYGQWLKSGTPPERNRVTVTDGTPWTVTTGVSGCQSGNGCVVVTVETVSGDNRYNLVSNPFPYPVDWSKVRVRVNTTNIYTPTQAQAAGFLSNQIWIWNGNTYNTWNDGASAGNLKYFQSFWVNVLPLAAGQTVELLIPAEVSTVSQAAPANLPWYLAWLDWVASPAQAAEKPAAAANPGWRIRLKLDNHATGWNEYTNQLGLWPGSVDGWDAEDLIEMPPFATPYMTLSFPHPEWPAVNGARRAGDYATDFRAVERPEQRKPTAIEWTFEIKANPVGGVVFLSWEGDDKILKRSRLVDLQTGKTIKPADRLWTKKGYSITLQGSPQRYVWRYLGP